MPYIIVEGDLGGGGRLENQGLIQGNKNIDNIHLSSRQALIRRNTKQNVRTSVSGLKGSKYDYTYN